MPARVLVVDDQEPFRSVAAAVVAATPGFTVVGEAATGEQAVELAALLRPDVVLMDVKLPGIDGLAATRAITRHDSSVTVLLLSTYDVEDYAAEALACGAVGFVPKPDFGPDVLLGLGRTASPS